MNMFHHVITICILLLSKTDANSTDLIEEDSSGCLVPTGNIILTEFNTNTLLNPGTLAPIGASVIYACQQSYSLEGKMLLSTLNFCEKKTSANWAFPHPECIKLCPPIQGYTIEAHCEYKGRTVSCEENVKSNTIARINCAFLYEKPKDEQLHDVIRCQSNGTWDYQPFKCEQICGAVDNTNQSHYNWLLSMDRSLRKPIEVPWHINVYSIGNNERYQYICGGTLIHAKVVISAAHCFWNDEKSVPYDKSKFIVTAGKFNRDYYSDKETFEVQRSFLFKIDIPAVFRDSLNDYKGNIAILTLNNYIKLKTHIVPLCVPWTTHNGIFDEVGYGLVVGLGAVDIETNYPLLRSVYMEGFSAKKCKNKGLIGNYSIAKDEFCAYPIIKSENICKGDEGAAYVIYDRGYPWFAGVFSHIIISNTSYNSECDEKLSRIFTSFYPYEFIIKNIVNTVSSADIKTLIANEVTNPNSNRSLGCSVPTNNLILTDVETKTDLEPGIVILDDVTVDYSCSEEHVLEGEITNSCNGRRWRKMHPKCIKTCSPIPGHTIRVNYYYNGQTVTNQTFLKSGTTAKIKCATMYRKSRKYLVNEDLHCQANGEWDYEPFQCEQICGSLDTNLPFSVQSTLTQPSKVPWHVAIYFKNKEKYEHICGGTIIQSKIIITAAHCFWDVSERSLQDSSKFIVTTGKFYRDYYADNEMLEVQKINVSKIDIPITFNGAHYDWANDIAVLTLNEHIEYKSHVRPACLTWREQSDQYIQSDIPGVVAGWGITDTGTYSPELRSVELVSIDSHTCKSKKITKNDNIAADKFCVETSGGKNVCQGDSGGGFVAPTKVNNKIYYNLWGVVSNGIIPRGEFVPECNSKFITTFTNVQYYKEMISNLVFKAYQ